jgi:hypothetical protein
MGDDAFGDARRSNHAISLYFADATLASAFVARWCVGSKAETAGGVFRVRAGTAGGGGAAQDGVRPGLPSGC